MIVDSNSNSSLGPARRKNTRIAIAALIAALMVFPGLRRTALAQAPEAPPAEPAVPHGEALPSPKPVRAPAVHPLPVPTADTAGDTRTLRATPHRPHAAGGVIAARGDTLYAAASDDRSPEEPAPGRNPARPGGESIERRLDRLERLVETLVRRDAEKRNFQFEFNGKNKPGNLRWNNEDMAEFHEKVRNEAEKSAREAEKMARKMQKDANSDLYGKRADREAPADSKGSRQALEDQRRALENQMRTLERQIQKLEREQRLIDQARDGEHRAQETKRRARAEDDNRDDDQKPASQK